MRFSLPLLACSTLVVVGAANAQSIHIPPQLRHPIQEAAAAATGLPASWLSNPSWLQIPTETAGGSGSFEGAASAVPLSLRNGAMPTGLSGFYDYQSNGMSPGYIEVNPTNRLQIHTAMMLAADPEAQSATRRSGYAYSADGGTTWATNPAVGDLRTGFPYLQTSADGVAFLGAHADPDGDGAIQSVLWFNSVPGSMDFTQLVALPTLSATGREGGVIWPSFELTQSEEGAVVAGTVSTAAGEDVAPLQVAAIDFGTGSGTWEEAGDSLSTITTGGRQVVARSAAGKIGIAWYRFSIDSTDFANGGVYFVESNDNGQTWGEIVRVMVGEQYVTDLNINGDQDTLDALSNLDLAYSGETPHIVFTSAINSLYRTEGIIHWSPTTGLDYATAAHAVEGMGAWGLDPGIAQPNMIPLSYPTISLGNDGQHVLVVFQANAQTLNETQDTIIGTTSPEGFEYFRLWGVGSNDGGNTWGTPFIVQDFAGAGTDSATIEYPALDEHSNVVGNVFEMNLQFLAKRYPGMYAFTASSASAGPVNEQFQYFQRQQLPTSLFQAVPNSVTGESVATGLAITALYPNPADNSATIGVSVAKTGTGSVEVWSALGERVASLASGSIAAGSHVYSLDASSLTTGRYYVALKVDGRSVMQPFSIVR